MNKVVGIYRREIVSKHSRSPRIYDYLGLVDLHMEGYDIFQSYLTFQELVRLDVSIVNTFERSRYLEIMQQFPLWPKEFYLPAFFMGNGVAPMKK